MARPVVYASAGAVLALVFAAPCAADIFTVGPDGEFTTLAFAVADADATAGDMHEIRLQAVTFTDKPFINYEGSKTLAISGGWDAAFDVQSTDPEATAFTILPGDDARPLTLRATDGVIEFSNATVFGGQRIGDGGGLSLRATSTGEVTVRDCVLRNNVGSTEFSNAGGGANIYADDAGRVRLARCDIRDNSLEAGGSAAGGGIYAASSDTATITLENNRVTGNRLRMLAGSTSPTISLDSAGVRLYAFGGSTVVLRGNRVVGNVIEAADTSVVNTQTLGLDANTGGAGGGVNATLVMRGNVIHANVSEAVLGTRAHMFVGTGNADSVDIGDTQITQGTGSAYGLFVSTYGDAPASVMHLTNLTIADNDGIGLRGNDRFPVSTLGTLFNSIVTGNGSASQPPVWMALGENLIDVQVAFAARVSGNYTLAPGATAAIDAGNATPTGGLGSVDAGGGSRVIGASVDIGAHEFGSLVLLSDGFE